MAKIQIKNILFHKDKEVFYEIERKTTSDLIELHYNQKVQQNIFRILRRVEGLQVIVFPIQDEKLYAFTLFKNSKNFIYINSYMPLGEQIFAAAHELYHLKYDLEQKSEILNDVDSSFNGNENEMKANSYAACFLVPKQHLFEEMRLLKINKGEIGVLEILKLVDSFAVPYKAMVLRLYEVNFINLEQAETLLAIPDKSPDDGVLLLMHQTRYALEWQKRTEEKEYGDLIKYATMNLEDFNLSRNKLKRDFSILSGDINLDEILMHGEEEKK